MSEKQLSFDVAMKIVSEQKWAPIKDIERLTMFIQEQQGKIEKLNEENKRLKERIQDCENQLFNCQTFRRI